MDRRHFLGGLIALGIAAVVPKGEATVIAETPIGFDPPEAFASWTEQAQLSSEALEHMGAIAEHVGAGMDTLSVTFDNLPADEEAFRQGLERFMQQCDEINNYYRPPGMSDAEWFGYDLRK